MHAAIDRCITVTNPPSGLKEENLAVKVEECAGQVRSGRGERRVGGRAVLLMWSAVGGRKDPCEGRR